jgi:hypothetical protein
MSFDVYETCGLEERGVLWEHVKFKAGITSNSMELGLLVTKKISELASAGVAEALLGETCKGYLALTIHFWVSQSSG